MDKKTILIGGAALAGLYLLTQPSGAAAGFGGGGGALPLLPQPEDSGNGNGGDTVFNFPEIPKPDFSSFGVAPAPAPVNEVKKTTQIPIGSSLDNLLMANLPPDFTKAYQGSALMTPEFREGTTPYAWAGYQPSKKAETPQKESKGAPWWNPFAWDRSDAITNYLDYSSSTWGLRTAKPTEKFFGGGKAGGKGFGGSWDVGQKAHHITTSKKVAAKRESVRRRQYGGYSTMGAGTTHAPGWKQLGLTQPTAPGQPDR